MESYEASSVERPQRYSAVFQARRTKFNQLSHEETTSGIISKICMLFDSISRLFRLDTMLGAEHMSQGAMSGSPGVTASTYMVKCVKESKLPFVTCLKGPFEYIKNIKQKLYDPTYPSSMIARQVEGLTQQLEVGQTLILPSATEGHSMLLMIKREQDVGGKKKFTVVQHNTGDGLRYHYYKIDERLGRKYQTALEIRDVSEENLCGENSTFFSQYFKGGSVENFYENTLPLLKGKIAPPSEDPRLWSHGQIGGSCAVSCYISALRYLLTKEEFHQFREESRLNIVLRMVKEIKSGWQSKVRTAVVVEILKKLRQSYEKRKVEFPQELANIQQQLELRTKDSQVAEKVTTTVERLEPDLRVSQAPPAAHSPGAATQELTTILSDLQKERWNQESIEAACKRMVNFGLLSSEVEGFSVAVKKLSAFACARPLTREQMAIIVIITSYAWKVLSDSAGEKPLASAEETFDVLYDILSQYAVKDQSSVQTTTTEIGRWKWICDLFHKEEIGESHALNTPIEPLAFQRMRKKMNPPS